MDDKLKQEADAKRLAEWHRYYSAKRIGQQWIQVNLLKDLAVRKVLEVGPYMGLVTAMLDNAGYEVTTLDVLPRAFERPSRPHISADLVGLEPASITGFDAILCCETFEHLAWQEVDGVLETFHGSGARHLIVSVPYEAFQIELLLYINRFIFRQRFALKKLRFLKSFTPHAEPYGHMWEVGYRGRSLRAWEAKLEAAGWRILLREFTHPTRSVFHVLGRSR